MADYYNIRIVDYGKGKFDIGFVHRLSKRRKGPATWLDGSRRKLVKLLTQGELRMKGKVN